MGKRYQELKKENAELRQALAAKFVKHSIRKGDLIVFLADQNAKPGQRGNRYDTSTIGMNFGVGWGAMENIRRLLTELAGGPVGVMASSRQEIDVFNLSRDERARFKATIEAIDAGHAKPTFKELENPLPPIYADANIHGSVAWAVTKQGKTPCASCGLALEDGIHGRDDCADRALDSIFKK